MTEPIARLLAWVLGRPTPMRATGAHRSGRLNRLRPAGPGRPKHAREVTTGTWGSFPPPAPQAAEVVEPAEAAVTLPELEEPGHLFIRPYVTRLWEERARKQREEDARWARRNDARQPYRDRDGTQPQPLVRAPACRTPSPCRRWPTRDSRTVVPPLLPMSEEEPGLSRCR